MSDFATIAAAVSETAAAHNDEEVIHILGNGARARLRAVPSGLVEEAQARILYPDPPMFQNEDMNKPEPNPLDPAYIKQVEAVDRLRGLAAMDVALTIGVELIDPIPTDGKWLQRLRFLEKRGLIDLSEYDLEDEMVLNYVYLKFEAITMPDLDIILKKSRMTQEEYDVAKASFRGDEGRGAD